MMVSLMLNDGRYGEEYDGKNPAPIALSDTILPRDGQIIITTFKYETGNKDIKDQSALYLSQDYSYPRLNFINFFSPKKMESAKANVIDTVFPGSDFMSKYTFKHPMQALIYLYPYATIAGSIGKDEGFQPFFFMVNLLESNKYWASP